MDREIGSLGHPPNSLSPASFGQLSFMLGTPSLSISSNLHPPLDFGPASFGQLSRLSFKPSPSESGQGLHLFQHYLGKDQSNLKYHLHQNQDILPWNLNQDYLDIDLKSEIPSPSESGHPFNPDKPGRSGH